MTKEERREILERIQERRKRFILLEWYSVDAKTYLNDTEILLNELDKMEALCQNGKSAIDTNKRLADEIMELAEERDSYKALAEAEPARADEAEKENRRWNDQDCNTCPIKGVSVGDSGCDEICFSRATLTSYFSEVIAERDSYKDQLRQLQKECFGIAKTPDLFNKIFAERDKWKARAEAFENAIQIVAACQSCKHFCTDKCKTCCEREEDWNGRQYSMTKEANWEFDEQRFVVGGGSDG